MLNMLNVELVEAKTNTNNCVQYTTDHVLP